MEKSTAEDEHESASAASQCLRKESKLVKISENLSDDKNSKMAPHVVCEKLMNVQETKTRNERKGRSHDSPEAAKKKDHQKAKKITKSLADMVSREGSVEMLIDPGGPPNPVCNVDDISAEELRESLFRFKENPVEPFGFLKDIMDDGTKDDYTSGERIKFTDIDAQLESLVKRVELNKLLLERTNRRVRDIDFLAERTKMLALKDFNYDEKSFLDLKEVGNLDESEPAPTVDVELPGIDELRKTMNVTLELLGYVQKIANGEMTPNDLPSELLNHMESLTTEDDG